MINSGLGLVFWKSYQEPLKIILYICFTVIGVRSKITCIPPPDKKNPLYKSVAIFNDQGLRFCGSTFGSGSDPNENLEFHIFIISFYLLILVRSSILKWKMDFICWIMIIYYFGLAFRLFLIKILVGSLARSDS